jgi:probable O-glycosylation ligase (exosortase A-associated)
MLILLLLIITTVWALRSPWIGILTWTCVSLMSPHIQFGYSAAGWPVATGVALTTMFGMLANKDRQSPFIGAGSWWLLAFTIWICVTLPFSIFYNESYPLWERSMKIFLMTYVSIVLLTDKKKLDAFIWVIVVSIGYYGVKGGVFTAATGGNYKVWGPGGFIEGNNEIAVAVITIVPLMRYLQLQMVNKRAILAMHVSMALSVITALGTYSRGALLALAAMGMVFWLKSERKGLWAVLIFAISSAGLSLMPEAWWERMSTIKTYNSDESALGRINAWWMAWNLAKDRVFGGGFSIWNSIVFRRYAPVGDDPHAAHSIYFQVMGEHGFIGLFFFLGIGVATWMAAWRMKRAGRRNPEHQWAADLGQMIQVSMIGFAVGGAFLSLAYYDLIYDLMVIAVLGERFVTRTRPAGPVGAAFMPNRSPPGRPPPMRPQRP